MAFIPMLAMPTFELNTVSSETDGLNNAPVSIEKEKDIDEARKEKAAKIDAYYAKHNLPLEGYGMQFVKTAEKYGLPYNFLPAIAMRETTGGKFACYKNPFGWGSCKIKFSDFNEAIEVVGKNLGGANPKTARYYGFSDIEKKLYYYNGTVIDGYEDQVMAIMNKIHKTDVNKEVMLAEK
ncbi:MAG: hypothetical protein RI945_319 [Candidatus Parcubacteria bacterium]